MRFNIFMLTLIVALLMSISSGFALYCFPREFLLNAANGCLESAVTGLATNSSWSEVTDIWVVGSSYDRLCHMNATGQLKSDSTFNCSVSGAGAGDPAGFTFNVTEGTPTDVWLADSADDFIYHLNATCSNSSDTTGHFAVAPSICNGTRGVVINKTGGAPTDFWVICSTPAFMFHFNATGSLSSDPTGNFSLSALGVLYPRGVMTNATNSKPVAFWFVDNSKKNIYVANATGSLIDTIPITDSGIGQSAGITRANGTSYLFVGNNYQDGVEVVWNPVISTSLSGVTLSSMRCSNESYVDILFTGTGRANYVLHMALVNNNKSMWGCTYEANAVDKITNVNTSFYCQSTINSSAIVKSSRIIVKQSAAVGWNSPGNIAGGIAASSVVAIIIIYKFTKKYKSKGW